MFVDNSLPKETFDSTHNENYSSKPQKSWRTLTFFKNTGLMIRFDLPKQSIYFSFIDKTSVNSYQSFNDGFVIKLDLFALNELVFCFSFSEPASWESWREKSNVKYQISLTPFKIQSVTLTSKKSIDRESYALKLAVYSNKENVKQFILSPYEFELIKDLMVAFRQRIINQFSLGVPPS